MSPESMLEWLRTYKARVKFETGFVEVSCGGLSRRRKTLEEAILVHESDRQKRPNEALCRAPGCGRAVLWVPNAQGQRIPVDPEPIDAVLDEKGPLILVLQGGFSKNARRPRDREVPDVRGRVAHRTTCGGDAFNGERLSGAFDKKEGES